MNSTRPQFPQGQLICPLHPPEPIKGVCLAKGSCENRFLCRHCRRTHDNNHLNLYEELEELLNGNLAGDIMKGFAGIMNNIENQNVQSNRNIQRLGKQVETLFDRIQQFVSQKLTQTKHAILEDIQSKFTVNNHKIKNAILKAQEDLETSFMNASNQSFRSIPSLENLVHVICSTDSLRQSLAEDPSLDSKSINELAEKYLDPPTLNLMLKNVQSSFEGVCQDITDKLLSKRVMENKVPKNNNFSEVGRALNQDLKQRGFQRSEEVIELPQEPQTMSFTNSPFAKFSFAQLKNQGNGLGFAPNPNLLKDVSNQAGSKSPVKPFGNKSPSKIFLNDFGSNNTDSNNSFLKQQNQATQSPFLKSQPQFSFNSQFQAEETPITPISEGSKLQTIPGFATTNFSLSKPSPTRSHKSSSFFQNRLGFNDILTNARSGRSSTMKGDIMNSNNSLYQGQEENSFHSMQLENEGRRSSKSPVPKHGAQDLLKIFQKADQNASSGDPLNQPLMKLSQNPIEIDDDPVTPTVSKSALINDPRKRQITPQKSSRGTSLKRSGEVVEFERSINTRHKQILFGAMIHISSRNQLITAGSEGMIKIWDLQKNQNIYSFTAHKGEIFRLFYIEEKDMLVSSGLDNLVYVWDCRNQYKQVSYFKRHAGPVYALEYLPDQNSVVSGGEDSHLRFWTVENGKEGSPMKTSDLKIGSLCYIKKSKRLAVGLDNGSINLVGVTGTNKKLLYTLKGHSQYVFNLVYNEENNILVSGSEDGYARLWRLYPERGECVKEFGMKNKMIRSLVVFSERDLVITNHTDNFIRVWKTSSGENVAKYSDKSFGESLIRVKNSNKILTGNSSEIKIWSVNY